MVEFAENHQPSRALNDAQYVLQSVYKTLDTEDPISFPLAYFCTASLISSDIKKRFYEGIRMTVDTGKQMQYPVHVIAAIFDGFSANRKFWLDHFEDKRDVTGIHVYKGTHISDIDNDCPFIVFIVDPPHILKRLRNCLHDSFWGNEDN